MNRRETRLLHANVNSQNLRNLRAVIIKQLKTSALNTICYSERLGAIMIC